MKKIFRLFLLFLGIGFLYQNLIQSMDSSSDDTEITSMDIDSDVDSPDGSGSESVSLDLNLYDDQVDEMMERGPSKRRKKNVSSSSSSNISQVTFVSSDGASFSVSQDIAKLSDLYHEYIKNDYRETFHFAYLNSQKLQDVITLMTKFSRGDNVDNIVIKDFFDKQTSEILKTADATLYMGLKALTRALIRLYIFKFFQINNNATTEEIQNSITTLYQGMERKHLLLAGIASEEYDYVSRSLGVAALRTQIVNGTLFLYDTSKYALLNPTYKTEYVVDPYFKVDDPRDAVKKPLRRPVYKKVFTHSSFYGLNMLANKDSIINFKLEGTSIIDLPTETFRGFNNLKVLDLGNNMIQKIQPRAFEGCSSLQSLNLSYCHILYFNPDVFKGISNLQDLNLSNNAIQELEKGVFEGLGNLKYLNLSNSSIKELEKGVFGGLGNLQDLNLSNSRIQELKKGVFEGLGNLKDLNLSNNGIQELKKGLFEGLDNLQSLDLSSNLLLELKKSVFSEISNLQKLNLKNNRLTNLSREVFQDLRNLKKLDLSDNQLTNLNPEIFQDMKDLQDLEIGGNPLPSQLNVGILKAIIKTKID